MIRNYLKIYIGSVLAVFFFFCAVAQAENNYTDKEIVKAIKQGEKELIHQLLDAGKLETGDQFGRKDASPLYYAIRYHQPDIAHLLLQFNADPNQYYKNKPMLMWAVRHHSVEIARLLLDYGADVDASDDHGYTALIMATWMNQVDFLDLLIEYGADLDIEDESGKLAVNYAYYNGEKSTGRFYERILFQRRFIEARPEYHDGPFVKWLDDSTAQVMYTYYDPFDSVVRRVDSLFKAPGHRFSFKGFVFDTTTYNIAPVETDSQFVFENIHKVFVLNDIHGHYDRFVEILIASGIIDEQLNWNFTDGHLILNGDIVDRGDKVTETLWFIYQLEKQARAAGGHVHFLLGNHELMIMQGETVYTSKKIKFFRNYFDWDYSKLFSQSTFLGEWLRTQNSMIKLNNYLFVHGGISYEFYQTRMSIREINMKVRKKLQNEACECEMLFSKSGPFWYRGYIWEGEGFKKITNTQLSEILDYYNASRIVVGHTIIEQIQLLYDNRVIAISVPFHDPEDECHGLLIQKGNFYKVTRFKEPQLLF